MTTTPPTRIMRRERANSLFDAEDTIKTNVNFRQSRAGEIALGETDVQISTTGDEPKWPGAMGQHSGYDYEGGTDLISHRSSTKSAPFHMAGRDVQYENTYILNPPKKFNSALVSRMIQHILDTNLKGRQYDPTTVPSLTKQLAEEIKTKVKALKFPRYKLVSLVNIGQKKNHDVRIGTRCIWDPSRDNYATGCFENTTLYCTATLYAIYFE